MSQGLVAQQRQFCRAQCKEKEEKVDRPWERWEDNIKDWTGMNFASPTRTTENRTRWKRIVVKSSVVPEHPKRLWDRLD